MASPLPSRSSPYPIRKSKNGGMAPSFRAENIKIEKKVLTIFYCLHLKCYLCIRKYKMGKSLTASSLRIPQDGNVARVTGCSGAIRTACPPASLAQLARARDL